VQVGDQGSEADFQLPNKTGKFVRIADLEAAMVEMSVVDAVDGSSTGIAMCQSCGVLENH